MGIKKGGVKTPFNYKTLKIKKMGLLKKQLQTYFYGWDIHPYIEYMDVEDLHELQDFKERIEDVEMELEKFNKKLEQSEKGLQLFTNKINTRYRDE